jgi:predicted nucleic acid-binding protein
VAWAYFDTSALVKRYIDEAGRRGVLQLLRRHDCVTSAVLPVELRSALRRRISEGTLDAARLPEILKRVTTDRAYWTLVEIGNDVLAAAEALVSTHPLRTLDAIHVASAQLFAARTTASELIFVSADVRQTAAAAAVGMTIRHIRS